MYNFLLIVKDKNKSFIYHSHVICLSPSHQHFIKYLLTPFTWHWFFTTVISSSLIPLSFIQILPIWHPLIHFWSIRQIDIYSSSITLELMVHSSSTSHPTCYPFIIYLSFICHSLNPTCYTFINSSSLLHPHSICHYQRIH